MRVRGVPLRLFPHEAVSDAIRAAGDWYEAGILDAVRERVPRASTIVDGGAHLGNHSVYWLEYVQPAALFAFEPMPETYRLLAWNLSRYPAAYPLPLALSDVAGGLRMVRDNVNRGRSHVSPAGEQEARAVRLDDLDLGEVTLLKLDVEGWQAHALRGARETLGRWHPTLWVEDGEGLVGRTLENLALDDRSLEGYRLLERFPGANDLWVWE